MTYNARAGWPCHARPRLARHSQLVAAVRQFQGCCKRWRRIPAPHACSAHMAARLSAALSQTTCFDARLQEVNRVSEVVTSLADPSANVIFGAVIDDQVGCAALFAPCCRGVEKVH